MSVCALVINEVGMDRALIPPLTPVSGRLPRAVFITDPHVSQAEQDMLDQAAKDPHFQHPRYGTLARLLDDEQHEWEFRLMNFTVTVGQEHRIASIGHTTNKANPALRFIRYEDPVTGKWTAWTQISGR
jgi:hypothetical protein